MLFVQYPGPTNREGPLQCSEAHFAQRRTLRLVTMVGTRARSRSIWEEIERKILDPLGTLDFRNLMGRPARVFLALNICVIGRRLDRSLAF